MIIRVISLLLLFFAFSAPLPAQDVSGSKDHPLITRYPGSVITYYDQQQFDEYVLPLGGLVAKGSDFAFAEQLDLGGRITRIHYALTATMVSSIEVFRNYTDALAQAAFETLASGKAEKGSNDIAGPNWTNRVFKGLPPVAFGNLGNFGFTDRRRYVAAKASGASGDVYVSLMVVQRKDNEVHAQLDIIEVQPVKSGLIQVDAAYLKSELERTGHVAIYGILFDVDKSEIKPESQPTLVEIAKLLGANGGLKLYVVGHTDMTGTYEHNTKLSDERAKRVVSALTEQHGIAAARLSGYGVGPLCPVASNATEEGRSKNRRVELVAK